MSEVFKIRSNDGWYGEQNSWCISEDQSPIFLNRKRAEKKIRDEIKVNQHRVDEWGTRSVKGMPAWWLPELGAWKSAKIIAFKLVQIAD